MYQKIVQLDNSDQIMVEWENDVSNMKMYPSANAPLDSDL